MMDVTIIGLGQMGHTLAELMLKSGKSVSLWNRSAAKAAALVERGATLALTRVGNRGQPCNHYLRI